MSPELHYLKTTAPQGVVVYSMRALDRALESAGVACRTNLQNPAQILVTKALGKFRLMRNVRRSEQGPVFVSLMGPYEGKILPFACWTEIVPYCYDTWPNLYPTWLSLFRRYRVRLAFVSARQSVQYFNEVLPEMKCVWLPEAVDPDEYDGSTPLVNRDIDVLELGRRYEYLHDAITVPLKTAGRTHVYQAYFGEIMFPDQAALVDGMGRSKISVCYPSSITHPARSGTVETVTLRYFESMASKNIILGHAPSELIDLFGYNPVVQVQQGREAEQISSILEDVGSYQALVDRNYQRLLEVGTWKTRVDSILREFAQSFPVRVFARQTPL